MPGTLRVMLGQRIVGTISNLAGDSNLFAFDDEYVADSDRPVLSQSFLDPNGNLTLTVPRTTRYAPAFFANLLPEEANMMRALIAKQYNIADRARDFPYLQVLGRDLPGAVVISPLNVFGEEAVEPATTTEPPASGKAPFRFSLAGAQVKFSASLVGKRLTISIDGFGGSWIVKPATNDWPRLPENEYAVMSLGASIGLNVPDIRLDPIEDIDGFPRDLSRLRDDEPRLAYSIRRFDRSDSGRIHGEDGLREFAWPRSVTSVRFPPPLKVTTFNRPKNARKLLTKMVKLRWGRGPGLYRRVRGDSGPQYLPPPSCTMFRPIGAVRG